MSEHGDAGSGGPVAGSAAATPEAATPEAATPESGHDAAGAAAPDPSREAVALAKAAFDFARVGDEARLGQLLDLGVPADLADSHGNTLLMVAAFHGHAVAVATLIVKGADPRVLNDQGQGAVDLARDQGHAAVIGTLEVALSAL